MAQLQQLGYLLHHVAFVLDRQSDQVLQERLGIGFSQYKILLTLKENDDVLQRHIADYLGQTEASISRQISKMADDGLIKSYVSPFNRRERLAMLTPKGLMMVDEATEALNRYHEPMFRELGEKERIQLHETLQTIHKEICREGRPGRCKQSQLG